MEKTLRERDGRLVDNWYIASLGKELKTGSLLSRKVYDRHYVLFRDETGTARALPDRCLHRGTKLSEGRCEDGSVQCPYHGWRFDGLGNVIEIPSEGKIGAPGSPLRPGLRLTQVPCIEQDGAVWIWTGDQAPSETRPPWRFPFRGEKNWFGYFMVTDFDNEVTNLAENFLDVPHTIFVHRHWFRRPSLKSVPADIDVKNGRVLVTYKSKNDEIGFTKRLINPSGKPMEHTDEFIFPNITRVDYRFGDSSHFIINSQCTPVETMKTRVYTYIGFRVNFLFGGFAPALYPLLRWYTRQVIEQDVVIMKNQGENLLRHPEQPFVFTEIDEIHLAVEKLRDMGRKGHLDRIETFEKFSQREFWI